MSLAEQILAAVPPEAQDAVVEASIAACEDLMRRHLAARMGGWSPKRLAAVAAQRGARCVLTTDPTMPNGVRIEFEPLNVPAFLTEVPT